MNPESVDVRRAVVTDLPAMRGLWQQAGLDSPALEKRFTEFQLVTAGGMPVACAGLKVEAGQGLFHGECFGSEAAKQHRKILLDRVINVARNHGLARVWVARADEFLGGAGFSRPGDSDFNRLPTVFGHAGPDWQMLRLREDSENAISLEKELELFQLQAKAETERTMKSAKVIKAVAMVVALLVCLIVIVAGLAWIKAMPGLRGR